MANGIIRTNPIGRYTLWDMRTDANEVDAALGAEFWDEAAASGNTGNIASIINADRSSLIGVQTATGIITSQTQSDSSSLSGTSGGTATGNIVSVTNSDRSALIGVQTVGGAINSRVNSDRAQIVGTQSVSGLITSRVNSDRSALTGIQSVGGVIQSITKADISALSGVQGSPVSGVITSVCNPDTSILVGTQSVEPVTIGISGGFALKKPAKRYKKIREYVETAIESVGVDELPQNEVDSLESEIIRAVAARQFKEELYMAIYARDLVQVRIDGLRQELEDEDDLLLLA